MEFQHSIKTTSSPDAIWRLWTDVENWPSWNPQLRSASLGGPFRVGAAGTLKPRTGPATTFEITAIEPGAAYTYRICLPRANQYVERRLHTAGSRTFFTQRVWFDGPLGFVFGQLLGSRYRAALPKTMDALRRVAEAPETSARVEAGRGRLQLKAGRLS